MNKKIVLVLIVIFVFTLISCSAPSEDIVKKYNVKLHFNLPEMGYENSINEYSEGELFYEPELSGNIIDNYYFNGWYFDQNFTNKVNNFPVTVTKNIDLYPKMEKYESVSTLSFFKNLSLSELDSFFKTKGTEKKDLIGETYYRFYDGRQYNSSDSTNGFKYLSEIIYYPSTQKFTISRYYENYSFIASLKYNYYYDGLLTFKYGDSFNDAQFVGNYKQTTVNINKYDIEAEYDVRFDYRVNKVYSYSGIEKLNKSNYNYQFTYATNLQKAKENFDEKESAEQCYNQIQSALNYAASLIAGIDSSYRIWGK